MSSPLTILPSPIGSGLPARSSGNSRETQQPGRFDALLKQKLDTRQIRFSRHANERLQQRGLQLNDRQTERLEQAVRKVADKGGRDSLVLLDQLALVVSVPNQTVVTLSDRDGLQERVFTNIDSAVIA